MHREFHAWVICLNMNIWCMLHSRSNEMCRWHCIYNHLHIQLILYMFVHIESYTHTHIHIYRVYNIYTRNMYIYIHTVTYVSIHLIYTFVIIHILIYIYIYISVRHRDPFQHCGTCSVFPPEATHRKPGGLCSAVAKFGSFLVTRSQGRCLQGGSCPGKRSIINGVDM